MERSIGWTTDGTGDGNSSGYSMADFTEWQRMLFAGASGADLSGVSPDYLNKLAVSGINSPVAVASGGALAYGFPYVNTASLNIVVPTPSISTRIDRIVLEVNWTAQTVRVVRVAGSEGGGAPSLTQTAGGTWQMPLAQASITTGGVITLTDQRKYLSVVGEGTISAANLADGAVLAEILDDDGAGSLLDADLLDGSHGTAFATSGHNHTGVYATAAHTHAGGDVFNDGEGNPGAVSNASNDGVSTYAARRDHIHTVAASAITYAALSRGGGVPMMIYRPNVNFDFTSLATLDYDTSAQDFDGLSLFSNNGGGEVTISVSCFVEFFVGGYLGHASGSAELWAQLWVEQWNGSAWNTLTGTARTIYIPTTNWNSFQINGGANIVATNKLRVRGQRGAGSDACRLSLDSSFTIKVLTA